MKDSDSIRETINKKMIRFHGNNCLDLKEKMKHNNIIDIKREIKETENKSLQNDFKSFLNKSNSLTNDEKNGAELFLEYLLNN
ncbi:hypothetical protein [Clostridium sardiniense]|uniref:hypothetical protein n=1 Tax=Clostridium sardiniense TaxID=29369 RepID=UPI00195805D0|nr:hypothetical protein [Clostridium sardiniense]MBM7836487.1 hypothetical protein [Clostridium sardiniense]